MLREVEGHKMKIQNYLMLVIVSCALVVSPARAQQTMPAQSADNRQGASLTSAERSFLMKAAKDGRMEVHGSQMAAERAENPEVKEFANKLVKDHQDANEELQTLAERKGVSLPGTEANQQSKSMSSDHAKLSKTTGAMFDQQWVKQQIKDHEKDVAEFQKMTTSATDPDVKAFAAKQLPVLQQHLETARNLQKSLGASSKSGAGKPTAQR